MDRLAPFATWLVKPALYCIAAALLFIVVLVTFLFLNVLFVQIGRIRDVPPSVPWVGLGNRKICARLRATLYEPMAGRGPIDEGYEKYSKNNLPFVLPGLHWPEVMIPPSQINWLVTQPQTALDGFQTQDDASGFEYLTHGPSLKAVHDFDVIRRDLTRQLTHILPEILEDLSVSIDEKLGFEDKEWTTIKLLPAFDYVATRAVNRIFTGLPLCRNQEYLTSIRWWTYGFAASGFVHRYLLTDSMRPTIMPLVSVITQFFAWRSRRFFRPLVEKRLAQTHTGSAEHKQIDDEQGRPNDCLQWIIESAVKRGASSELTVKNISGKLMLFNVFASFTTMNTSATLIFDLLAHPSCAAILDELRVEAEELLPQLTRGTTALRTNTPKLDSAIRESLRFSSMFARGTARKVVSPTGVTTPGGVYLPKGCRVGVPVACIHLDPAVQGWEDAATFVPLRYYNMAQESGEKQTSAVQISERYLAFSLGRHACPGRFFALEAMKLILSYVIVHYDLEPRERPPFITFGEASVPANKSTIRLRRRTKIESKGTKPL